MRRAAPVAVWAYLLAVLVMWLLIWVGGDRWWFATVVLFSPRGIAVAPLLVLIPLAAVARPRLVWPLLAGEALALFGIMSFCVPVGAIRSREAGTATLRVLTCNVQGKAFDEQALYEYLMLVNPDLVLLQECGAYHGRGLPENWTVARRGGQLVASRYPISTQRVLPMSSLYCQVQCGPSAVGICNVHLRTPRRALSEVLDRHTVVAPARGSALQAEIDRRDAQSRSVGQEIGLLPEIDIIAGDFNMPVESAIYRRWWRTYTNAFSTAGLGFGYTKRSNILGIEYGARIDHILLAKPWRVSRCWVGPDIGSDHRPLIADVAVPGQ